MLFKLKSCVLVHESDINLIHEFKPGLPRSICNEIVQQQGYVSGKVDSRYIQCFKNKNSLTFLNKYTYLINYDDIKTLTLGELNDLIAKYYKKLDYYNEQFPGSSSRDMKNKGSVYITERNNLKHKFFFNSNVHKN